MDKGRNNFRLLKVIGRIMLVAAVFPCLFPCAALWLSFKWWLPFTLILVASIVLFFLGRYCIKLSISENRSLQDKIRFTVAIVYGIYCLTFSSLAISWGTGATGESEYVLLLSIFILDACLFTMALIAAVKGAMKISCWLAVAGGICALPVGIFAIMIGIYSNKRLTTAVAAIERGSENCDTGE